MAGVDRRSVARREVHRVDDVFDADRQAAQRQRGKCLSRDLCLAFGAGKIERGERTNLGFARRDGIRARAHDRGHRQLAPFDPASKIKRRQHDNSPGRRQDPRSWVHVLLNHILSRRKSAHQY